MTPVGMQALQIEPGVHCLFSGLRHVLVHQLPEAAETADEADIYFQTGGLNVEYERGAFRIWLASREQILRRFAELYGMQPHISLHVESGADAIEPLRDTLAAGRLAVLFLRTSVIEYHEAFRDASARQHIVLLHGLDEVRQAAFIADTAFYDNAGSVQTFSGAIPLPLLREGLTGCASFEAAPGREPLPEPRRVQEALARMDAFVRGRELPGGRWQGMSAYRALMDNLANLSDLEDRIFTDMCKHAYYGLRIGGVVHQLEYFSRFLARHRHRFERMDELAAALEELRKDWRPALMQLYKIGLSVQRQKLASLQERCISLLDRHERFVRELLDAARTMRTRESALL
ncbi:BtrH N-terminal domain-containing protein [Paenibacillus hamazuiensis]|uniref:BtrH N-terminal domain-containing protein n=1 Tax=Paenibacillus hamazuiensis TaxID=2936508 RepID=UPI00200C0231|nr:BtrH N-terminal domain-containing protein [Paenibacillus hamazuiensis]